MCYGCLYAKAKAMNLLHFTKHEGKETAAAQKKRKKLWPREIERETESELYQKGTAIPVYKVNLNII